MRRVEHGATLSSWLQFHFSLDILLLTLGLDAAMIEKSIDATRPFLRWVGGKQNLTAKLIDLLPSNYKTRVYREPFLGGASLYFLTRPKVAYLSDLNGHLIDCYKSIRDNPEQVARALSQHRKRDSKAHYYLVRKSYNSAQSSAAQAARFIYLNKTCFNGIFRVNQRGEFNVPYGFKETPAIPSRSEILRVSVFLRNAKLDAAPYERALSKARAGDFVYLDPPYPPLNGTAYFTHYTKERFGVNDQVQLARLFDELSRRRCVVMMTNADTPLIRDLYRRQNITTIFARRYVTSQSVKYRIRELVIRNYGNK